jgi:hypothetical protein
MANTVLAKNAGQVAAAAAPDPFEFHVYGPRNMHAASELETTSAQAGQ